MRDRRAGLGVPVGGPYLTFGLTHTRDRAPGFGRAQPSLLRVGQICSPNLGSHFSPPNGKGTVWLRHLDGDPGLIVGRPNA